MPLLAVWICVNIIDLVSLEVVETFEWSGEGQAVVVEVSEDGQYAYVGFDITDVLVVIDLENMEEVNTIQNFPIYLLSFSWISTGGRSSFKFTRFKVSPDGNHIIVGNSENEVLYYNAFTGAIDFSVSGIPNCKVVQLSGDGNYTVAP